MKAKVLRFLLLVVEAVILWPVIVIVEVLWLGYCIYAVKRLDGSIKDGLTLWFNYIKAGLVMNADFVQNGL